MPTVTGPDLRRERRAAEVSVIATAARMRISRQTVHAIERSAAPTADQVAEHRAAVCREVAAREGVSETTDQRRTA